MKRALLFLLCALMSTQMFSETLFGYLFPTLAYLERTTCYYTEGDEQYRTINRLSFEDNMFEIDGNDYIEYNDFWLREDKEGRILVYSEPAKKDLVLYDFTLEVGDTLTTLNIDMVPMTEGDPILPGLKSIVVDYPIYINGEIIPIDTLIVTDVSMVMMRDSNEYKKWTFSNGMEYMEYIGNLGADFFPIIKNPWEDIPTCCIEERLVCASIYDRLIYQMDDAEMQRLNAECQCSSWASKWCDTWNVLEFDGMAFEQTAQTWQYKLAYDTIIDGKEYQAVTRHWTADEEKTKEYVAAVRFEENKKAFIYYDNAEYLLYDFNSDLIEGDTLEVFAGINNYVHFSTYKCVIKSVEHTEGGITESTYSMDIIDPFTGKVFPSPMVWKEFVGSYNGILHGDLLVPGNSNYHLLCAYKNSSIVYSTEDEGFTEYGCEYNAGPFNEKLLGTWRVVGGNEIISISDSIIVFIGLTQKYTASATQLTVERLWIPEEESYRWANCNYTLSNDTLWIDNFVPLLVATYPPTFGPITLVKVKHEDLFPTLWGLQRTVCNEYCGDTEDDNSANSTYKQTFDQIFFENDKPYILCNDYLLREEDNKMLIYSQLLNKDLVLYDFTLEVGDSLPALYIDYHAHNAMDWMPYNPDVVDYNKDFDGTIYPADTFVVTDVSNVTLLDGKEYKKWTFDNGMEYVEGIGMYGGRRNGNFFGLIQDVVVPCHIGTHLVCASRNNKLLYQMDAAEMERLGAECLCDVETSYKDQWCNQWNVLTFDGWFFDETARTSQYRLGKDTVIGDYTYSKFTSRTSVRFTSDRKVYVYYEGFDDNDPYTPDLPTGEYLAYDFSAQVGDTLEVFSGIGRYSTLHCIVVDVLTNPETNLRTITLQALCDYEDGDVFEGGEITWLEGVGSPVHGFLMETPSACGWVGAYTNILLCAYKDDELKYTDDSYNTFGCEYNAGVVSEDHFPMLAGLSRTICREHYGSDVENSLQNNTYLEVFTTPTLENGHLYLYHENMLIREEDDKILIVSRTLDNLEPKEFVLYDFTLQVGDSLPMLYIDYYDNGSWIPNYELLNVVDYRRDEDGTKHPADILIVTDVSMITLSDGKEYKKWTFNNGMEYVEGIGSFGNDQWSGDFFQLIANKGVPTSLLGEHLVCASKNGQLLYQMDDAEMERLGAECLCDVEKKWTDTWCDTWNVLEHDRQYSGTGNYNEQTWRHYLAQDTIINGQTYTYVNCYWTLEESKVYRIALVRFTEDKKVYLLSGNQEQLVYDFSVEVGDTIETIVGAFYGNARQQLVVHQVDVDDATNRKTITLYPLCKLEEDFDCDQCDENGYYLSECCPVQWIEGVGSTDGFLMGDLPCSDWVGGVGCKLLCAYKNDELQYISKLYQGDYGCEYNAVEQNAADLFPTLWGLQRTVFHHYTECSDNYSSLTAPGEIVIINGKPYLRVGEWFLREANNQVLIYSAAYDTDFVLYDWNLEVGDSISLLAMDYGVHPEYAVSVVDYRVIVDIDENGDLLMDTIPTDKAVVDKISTITLLDGKEYKTWHLATEWAGGITYVEGIGILSEGYGGGDYFGLIIPEAISTCYLGDLLVCVSRNGQLLYQMDDAEMERLGAECLCEYDRGPLKDNAKNGKIGGRPTPTQWNQLELDLREMENGNTILRAETFSYTLENDSIVANDKTYYQLARQSTKDTATTKSFIGALHFGEDEDNRVYFLRDGVEYVLYDFTAEPGDTVEIFAGINNYPQDSTYTHVVTGKDTLENGACRMLLEVVFPDETATAENAEKVWLAGLGSVDGIVHNAATRATTARSSDTQTSVMLCAWRDDNCLYTTDHPDYDTFGCVYNQDPTSIEDTHSPSPTTDYKKLLHNGQLLIIHEGKTYNVLGVQVK